ncbi:hypothetical protein [Desulfosporosinus sp. Sb-LF]|uniref:hypothetical protein n=1 Tax=Desulfosporosinus sp. Sb-LF TaxID=2560027 RepID=UPI00107F469E|nr:hypothetical protein [Desulfosporosinus sp. Sb-LF]TGE32809.1 hypothetical protein E4K68_10675 [Desulfosporosinus sp. Sb-LF]
MVVQNYEQFKTWAMRLSLVTMVLVTLLSVINKVKIFDIIVRAGVSFGVMYLLMVGILRLFERTAPQQLQKETTSSDIGRGSFIDFSVGDDTQQAPQGEDSQFPGQVDRDVSAGLPDSERQAEIVRRMGWDETKDKE